MGILILYYLFVSHAHTCHLLIIILINVCYVRILLVAVEFVSLILYIIIIILLIIIIYNIIIYIIIVLLYVCNASHPTICTTTHASQYQHANPSHSITPTRTNTHAIIASSHANNAHR